MRAASWLTNVDARGGGLMNGALTRVALRWTGACLAAAAMLAFGPTAIAQAAHYARSVNVALIPDDGSSSDGGTMPTSGTVTGADADSFDQFTFTELSLDQIDPSTLSQYDTVVLMQVSTADLSDAAKQTLSQFVTGGGKLIIHDADSTSGNDYSWLPVPAQTGQSCQNCGSSSGTSQIVENNTLVSANPSDASYVNVSELEGNTDAVGDANVMVTQDPRWFVDIRATNSLGDTGAVHTYATDNGLIIFNGYDTDDVGQTEDSGVDWLGKLWYLELAQGWDPDGLPHGTPVAPQPQPPPVLPPPAHACVSRGGSLAHQLVESLECQAIQTKLEAECGASIVFTFANPLKKLKTAKGLYDLRKAGRAKPIAKLANDLLKIKYIKGAPKGYRTGADLVEKFKKAKDAKDLIDVLLKVWRYLPKSEYGLLARDIADIAGLHSCVQGLANALSG
jgi:hypothetical protein